MQCGSEVHHHCDDQGTAGMDFCSGGKYVVLYRTERARNVVVCMLFKVINM